MNGPATTAPPAPAQFSIARVLVLVVILGAVGGSIFYWMEQQNRPKPLVKFTGQVLYKGAPVTTGTVLAQSLSDRNDMAIGPLAAPCLGVQAQTVALPRRTVLHHQLDVASAVRVDEVLSAGPAHHAGVQAGDRIVRVDGVPTPDVDTLHRMLGGERIGRGVAVELLRGGRKLVIELVPGRRD